MSTTLRHMQFSSPFSPPNGPDSLLSEDRCVRCGRPHNRQVRCLPDGRWFDGERGTWRDVQGEPAAWPDIVDYSLVHERRVRCAPLSLEDGVIALCQRCRPQQRRLQQRRHARSADFQKRALGDLFLGQYVS